MSATTKTCDACNAVVSWDGHRGFNLAHANCSKRGENAVSPDHKPCPQHGTLVWCIGPYSAFRACSFMNCRAGKKGKPHRYCAPRGQYAPSPANQPDNPAESPEELPDMPSPAVQTPDVQSAVAALMAALQPQPQKLELDEAKINALVSAAVDKKLSESTVTIIVKPDEKADGHKIEHPHPYLTRVIRLVNAGLPVYLWGPAGGGKTSAAMQVANALLRESEIDTLDPSTFRSMVQGYCTPDGNPVHTSFTRCWTGDGKIYIADECDNAPGHVQTLFNSALANGHAPLAWGNAERGKAFAFIGTGNTPGRPTRALPDRKPMSSAFMDRMYFVHWPLDEQSERQWSGVGGKAKRQIPSTETRAITNTAWVNWVQQLREWAVTNAPALLITPRASIVGLKALECGETPEQVADGLVFRGADDELRSKALNAVRLP